MSDRAIHMFPCDDCAPALSCWWRPSECGKARVTTNVAAIVAGSDADVRAIREYMAFHADPRPHQATDMLDAIARATIIPRRKLVELAERWREFANEHGDSVRAAAYAYCARELLALLEEVSDG